MNTNEKSLSPLQRLIRKFAASLPGTRLFSRSLSKIDNLTLKASHGKLTSTSLLAGLPVILLTTTGAKSGQPRSLPLVSILDPDTPSQMALIASNFGNQHHPAWYYNLKAYPQVTGSINGQTRAYTAREAAGEEYEQIWQRACATYAGFALYKQLAAPRVIPILVLEPENPE